MKSFTEALKGMIPAHKAATFLCEKHGQIDYTTYQGVDGSWKPAYCPVCQREAEELEAVTSVLRQEARARLDALIRALNVLGEYPPQDFGVMTFERFEADSDKKQKALFAAQRFADRFLQREFSKAQKQAAGDQSWKLENSRNLLLRGDFGTGKTHLALSILKRLDEVGLPGFYIRVPDLFDSLFCDESVDRSKALRLLQSVSCLVLDEVGVQSWSDAERKRLFQIFDGRTQQGRPTIVITNLEIPQLSQCLSPRVLQRFAERYYEVFCDWKSFRSKGARQSAVITAEEAF